MVKEEEGVVGEEFHGLFALLFHLWREGFHDGFPPPDGQVLSRGVKFHAVVNGCGGFHFRIAQKFASAEQGDVMFFVHLSVPVASTPEGSVPKMRNAVSFIAKEHRVWQVVI